MRAIRSKKEQLKEFDESIDWQREAKEDQKTLRFCPQCGKLVKPQLKEHKYFQNFYSCPYCGETIFRKVTAPGLTGRGYSYNKYPRRKR